MGINLVEKIDDLVPVKNVLISVSDKSGLEELINWMAGVNEEIRFFSTGGTYGKLKNILGQNAEGRLVQVSDYTGQPETQGGLVKTLDFKIYLGILTETYNPSHQSDLARTQAVPIDMVIVNLYPFQSTVSKADATPEQARGNIDIGGPCMIRAAAKNYIRVASVVNPAFYQDTIVEMFRNNGCTSLKFRYVLAKVAFAHTAGYDKAIAEYLAETEYEEVRSCYKSII